MVLGIAAGTYAAEAVFRYGMLVPRVPETDRHFRALVSDHWPEPVAAAKKAGVVRILGLADSYGVAGFETNYHYVLGSILRERGYPVEIVNFSVPAYSIEQERDLLKRFGDRYAPDIVLHSFFVGNDFALGSDETLRYKGVDVDVDPGLAGWLPHRLTLGRWLVRSGRVRNELRRAELDRESGYGEGMISRDQFLEIEVVRLGACRKPRSDGAAWPATTVVLDSLRAEIDTMGAEHVMVIHPDQLQVEPALFDELLETYDLRREDYDLELPQKFLIAWAESRGVASVNLLPIHRGRGAGGGLYLPRNTHYNDAGNRLVAEVLADALAPVVAALVDGRAAGGER